MDVEERTKDAILLTRKIMLSVIDDPHTMIIMTSELVEPEEVEDKITEILEYLEKTTPEEASE